MKFAFVLLLAVIISVTCEAGMAGEGTAAAAAASGESEKGKSMETKYFADYAAIRRVMEQYVESARQGKSEIMRKVFDDNEIMYAQVDGKISGGPIQLLFGGIDSRPPSADVVTEITSIQVYETIANARVESKNWGGTSYSDMFLLIKDAEGWKIIAKIYHHNQ